MHPDDRCLYAHYDTGKDAEEPKRKLPGGPPIAGRNAMLQSPVYKDWREARMKIEPEPEEPTPPVDVPLLAFVKPRGSKKHGAINIPPPFEGNANGNPEAAGPLTFKAGSNFKSVDSQNYDGISKVPAPKTWSQVAMSKPALTKKPSKGSTSAPFTSQVESVDLAVTDLRMSGAALQQRGVSKDVSTSRPSTAHSVTASRIKGALSRNNTNAVLDVTKPSNGKKLTADLCEAVASSHPSARRDGRGSNTQTQTDGFTNQDIRTQLFKERARVRNPKRV